ncbi:HEAT repeat domain-containing protein [bacterium]|nr:diguanylate cyclase [bacterium]MBU3955560.1 HEAT repeat domain-containing protein [bacterium]
MIKKNASDIAKIVPDYSGGEAYIVNEEELTRIKERSALSGLPGNMEIKRALEDKFINGPPGAMVVYMDINGFKPYNDNYGFIKGDKVIKELAGCFASSVKGFAGHIGGDDFAAVIEDTSFDSLMAAVIPFFEKKLEEFYDSLDYERKCIITFDRSRRRSRYPLMGLTVVGFGKIRDFKTADSVGEFAAELKGAAKLKSEKYMGNSIVFKYAGSSLTPLEDIICDEKIPLQIRRGAVEALGEGGDFSYGGILVKILGEDIEMLLKKSALYALGRLGLKETAPDVAKFLRHTSAHLRMRSSEALGEMGLPQYAESVAALLDDKNYFVRKAAVLALGKLADSAWCGLLKNKLNDGGANYRRVSDEAFISLAMLGDKDTLESLPVFINNDTVGMDLRVRALRIMRELENYPGGALVLKNMEMKSSVIKAECLEAVADLLRRGALKLDEEKEEALFSLVSDKSAGVRRALAFFCGESAGKFSVTALNTLIKDVSPEVRGSAVSALGKFPGRGEDILTFFDDVSSFVRFSAVKALVETDMPDYILSRAVEKLRLLLKDPSHEVAEAASKTILSIIRRKKEII